MTRPTTTNSVDVRRLVAIMNLCLAGVGLIQLAVNVSGYQKLPMRFINEYGPFMKEMFPRMSLATGIFLPALALAGIQLLLHKRYAVVLCNMVFVAESVFFIIVLSSWSFGLSPLNPLVIAIGLMNSGLALQIIFAYPVVGLFLINLRRFTPSVP